MARKTTQDVIPEDLQPYYQGKSTSWRRWVGPVLRGLLLLVLVGLIVWGGIWGISKLANRHSNNGSSTASTSSSTKNNGSSDSGKSSNSSKDSGSNSSNNSSNENTDNTNSQSNQNSSGASSTGNTPAATDNQDQSLANTGPGEVLAGFFVTVVVATLAYHLITSYRVNRVRG